MLGVGGLHGHGQRESSNLPFAYMQSAYEHWAFSHGIEHWLRKHAGYAMQEARQIFADDATGSTGAAPIAGIFSTDRVVRRRALKHAALRLPMRPTLRWLHVMGSGGWRDGSAGLQYARMMRTFQQMIDLCMADLRRERAPSSSALSVAPPDGERVS